MEIVPESIADLNWAIYTQDYLNPLWDLGRNKSAYTWVSGYDHLHPLWIEAASLAELGFFDGIFPAARVDDVAAQVNECFLEPKTAQFFSRFGYPELLLMLAKRVTVEPVSIIQEPNGPSFNTVVALWAGTANERFRKAVNIALGQSEDFNGVTVFYPELDRWVRTSEMMTNLKSSRDQAYADATVALLDVGSVQSAIGRITSKANKNWRERLIANFFEHFLFHGSTNNVRKTVQRLLKVLDLGEDASNAPAQSSTVITETVIP